MPRKKKTYKSGRYEVKNKHKYVYKLDRVTYRSSWELFFMMWLDNNPNVVEWGSENVCIDYYEPFEGTKKQYYVDFYMKDINDNKYIIEVKPEKQTVPPIPPKGKMTQRKNDRYEKERYDYAINMAKWDRAIDVALKNGFKFKIMTEKSLAKIGMKI